MFTLLVFLFKHLLLWTALSIVLTPILCAALFYYTSDDKDE